MSRFWRNLGIAFFSVMALTISAFSTKAAPFSSTNLIINGGFEQGISGIAPTGAVFGIWGHAQGFSTYFVPGRNGGRAPRATITSYVDPTGDGQGDAKWLHKPVVVTPGATYWFTGYYKSSVAAEADLEFKVGSGYQYFLKKPLAKATNWTFFSFFFTAPAGASEVRVITPIKKVGWIDIDDFRMFKQIPVTSLVNGGVALAFDDGWTEHQKLVAGILERAGLQGTFYICAGPGFLDAQGKIDGYMDAAQILDLARRGHVVGSHSMTHPDLTTLSVSQAQYEIVQSKNVLESIIFQPVSTFAYPFGAQNAAVVSIVQSAGYTSARSIESAFVRSGDPYRMTSWSPIFSTSLTSIKNKILEAKAKHKVIVISLHRIVPSNGSDEYYNTQSWLQDLVNFIKSSGVPHMTIPEALAIVG